MKPCSTLLMRWKPAYRSTWMRVNCCPLSASPQPDKRQCAKLGVYQAMTEQGIKKTELARRLGWHRQQVDRLFDLRHASKLDQIEAAAIVLGRHIEVTVA